ncbi:MAG TPA: N-acetylmuramoyl-L-alanine amidase, partial [Iamia sp.]|nr:N-acetylmuramoyl-L-alanine amidase [Iamia sp.]
MTRGAGALALAAALAGLVPATPPAAALARTVDHEVTTTPAGALTSTTVAIDEATTARRRAAPIEVAVEPGTQMVGVSWAGGDDVEVQVAAPEGDGWGPWADLHPDGPDGSDGGRVGGRTGVGPAWLGTAGVDRVAVQVVAGAPTALRVEAMRFAASPTARAVTYDRPATPAGGPAIATRASWAPGGWQGWRDGCTPAPTVMGALRFAVVHHTDGTNSYGAADVPGILAGIYRFHTGTNGWCDIAYNLFVDRFGTVWEGRTGGLSAPIMGGHAKGFNTNSVGIAMIGSHVSTAPSAAAMTALRDVLAWKLGSHGVDPQTSTPIVSQGSPRYPAGQTVVLPTVQGHRDSGVTACPGNLLYGRLPGLRNDVAARIAATNVPATWSPSTTGAVFFGRIDDAALGRRAANGRAGHYTSLVTRGGWPRDALATAIVLSAATDARIGGPDRLYRAAFGREAETSGLRYWVGRRDAGMSLTSMAHQF